MSSTYASTHFLRASYVSLVLSCFAFITSLAQSPVPARVLIYSATRGFRHDSIPTAIQALKTKGSSINVDFENTEDQTQFTDQILGGYDALLFLSTTGEVLDDTGKAAFQKYLNLGGNFIGVHAASDCLVNTTFYGQEIGAYFDYHADLQNATVNVIGPMNPSTAALPTRWQLTDEWYNFKSDPRALGATVILSVDESTYTDTGTRKFNQGSPHPTAWFQEHGAGVESGGIAGRSFYTSLGHLNETWEDDTFMAHVLGGISWTLQANTTKAFNSSAQVGNTAAPSGPSSSSASGSSLASGSSSASGSSTLGSSSTSTSPPSPSGALVSATNIGALTAAVMIVGAVVVFVLP